MSVARPALVALLVGAALLASPALLLQFQEPDECTNAVQPATDVAADGESVPVFRYEELSPDAKRAFDRARAADRSVTVSGARCPEAFSYTAERHRYEIVDDGSRYVLTTYAGDLLPEVPIAAGVLAALGAVLLGVGVATHDEREARFPALVGGVGLVSAVVVTVAVVLDQRLWAATGWTALVTAATLVGSGAALDRRRALLLGGVPTLLLGIASLSLTGATPAFVLPAALPLLLVGVGIAARTVLAHVWPQR